MSTCPTHEQLDRFVFGELPPDEVLPLQHHLARCAPCQREVEWMRAERALLAARSRRRSIPSARLLAAVQSRRLTARYRPPARANRWSPLAAGALCIALVTGLLCLRSPIPESNRDGPQLSQALMCIDPGAQEISRLESLFGACLVATPAPDGSCLDRSL